MRGETEIRADIARSLYDSIDESYGATVTVAKVGPSIYPSERPQVYHIPCGDAEVVWHTFPTGGIDKAFDCPYSAGSEQAAIFIDKIIETINPDEADNIPVDFEGDEEIIAEIISHMNRRDHNLVEINR